eukprot:1089607-Pleurochrysis_carterae.AAC.1
MYTDDVVVAAVGTDRVVALLRAWHKVPIPEKRQAGSSVLWLGVVFRRGCGRALFTARQDHQSDGQDPAHALAQYGHSGVAQA